jgi:hypothetical protein
MFLLRNRITIKVVHELTVDHRLILGVGVMVLRVNCSQSKTVIARK